MCPHVCKLMQTVLGILIVDFFTCVDIHGLQNQNTYPRCHASRLLICSFVVQHGCVWAVPLRNEKHDAIRAEYGGVTFRRTPENVGNVIKIYSASPAARGSA